MSRYAHTLLPDESEALDVLPSFPSSFKSPIADRQILAATGTDGRPQDGRFDSQNCLQERGVKADKSAHFESSKNDVKKSADDRAAKTEKHKKTAKNPLFLAVPSGEIGIRTREAGFPTYRISNPALSATQPSLRCSYLAPRTATLPTGENGPTHQLPTHIAMRSDNREYTGKHAESQDHPIATCERFDSQITAWTQQKIDDRTKTPTAWLGGVF